MEWTDKQQLDAWMEWKEKCDSQLCSDNNKIFLETKGNKKAKQLCSQYHINEKIDYGFVLFEAYAIREKYKEKPEYKGKSYKDGIFLDIIKSDTPPLKVLNGKFHWFLQTEIKDMFGLNNKNWTREKIQDSIDQELNEDGFSLEDLLPTEIVTPCDEVAFEDLIEIGLKETSQVFELLKDEEIVLLATKYKNIKRSDKFIIKYLDSNSSHITDVLNTNIPKKINKFLEKYNGEDLYSIEFLHKVIFQNLEKLAFLKISSDIKYKAVLSYIESYIEA